MTRFASVPIALLVALCAEGAGAQSIAMKLTCQNLGPPGMEAFGDQPGHTMRAVPYSCSVSGGPLDGGAITAHDWWDAKGTEWTLMLGAGVIRHPQGFAMYHDAEGRLSVQMKDGKAAGYAATGRGRYLAASGAAAPLAGKAYLWKVAPAGPTSFRVDVEVIER